VNTLAALLSHVVTVLQESGYCGAVRVLETHPFSGRQFALKVRAELVTGNALQIASTAMATMWTIHISF